MGKGNDVLKEYLGTTKRSKLAKQLGFDDSGFETWGSGRPGEGNHQEMREKKKQAEKDFINNNYHVQSAIDHGRSTGNKRADKLSKELKSTKDFEKAYKYMKKGHEHGGNGGNFSSMGDMMASQDYRFDKNMDQLRSSSGGGGGDDGEGDKGPFEPVGQSDAHKQAEEDYLAHYDDGNPLDTPDAMDSYKRRFNTITGEGSGIQFALDLSDAKGDWVANRFMPYMQDKVTLAGHEQHQAASNAIQLAGHLGIEPPTLSDPMETGKEWMDYIDDKVG